MELVFLAAAIVGLVSALVNLTATITTAVRKKKDHRSTKR